MAAEVPNKRSKDRYYGFIFAYGHGQYSDLDRLRLQELIKDKTRCRYGIYVEAKLRIEGLIEFIHAHSISSVRKLLRSAEVSPRTSSPKEIATRYKLIDGNWECGELPKGTGARTDIIRTAKEKSALSMKEQAIDIVKRERYETNKYDIPTSDVPSLGPEPIVTLEKMIQSYKELLNEHLVLCYALYQSNELSSALSGYGTVLIGNKSMDKTKLTKFGGAMADLLSYVRRVEVSMRKLEDDIRSTVYMMCEIPLYLKFDEYDPGGLYQRA